jgi:hypothetical protein
VSSIRAFNMRFTNSGAAESDGSASAASGASAPPADAAAAHGPRLRLTDEEIENIPHKEPPRVVTRDQVQQALQKFLEDLATAQKSKHHAVRSTDKVWQADVTLHLGLTDDISGPYTPRGGDGRDYDVADLAARIARQLPDSIPIANYNNFLKLKPTDTSLPGSITDQLRKKYEEKRDEIVARLPEKVRKIAREAMDLAIEKGVTYVVDAALKGAGINSDAEGEMKQAVQNYLKKITGDDSDHGE